MNKIKQMLSSNRLASYLAATATVAIVAVTAPGLIGRAGAASEPDDEDNTQVAELYGLQAAFHQAASYGGDINALMQLFTDESTLTLGGVTYTGKAQIQNAALTKWGPFLHHWVSLSPLFKTQFDIEGHTATFYFECHYADPSVTPYVLRVDGAATGKAKRVGGRWIFWDLHLGAAPPL